MKKKLISSLLALVLLFGLFAMPASAASTVGSTTTANLNFRDKASTSGKVLQVLPKGAQLIVLSSSNGWSKVVYDNTIGYCYKEYLKATTTVSGKFGTGTITGSDVRMRSGAGTSYSILGEYSKGTKMTVTGAKGGWYKVSYNGKTGFVSADYMTISVPAKATTTTVSAKTTTTTTTAVSYSGTITGSDVRMRSGASTNYRIVEELDLGTKVSIVGSKDGWYKVNHNGKSGYIIGDYVRLTPKTAYSSAKSATVTGTDCRLRMGPSTSFTTLKIYEKGTAMTVTGVYDNWYEVKINGQYGYMYKSIVAFKQASSVPAPQEKLDTTGTVNGDSVRMRKGPSTSYDTVDFYDKGTKVTVTGKTGSWYAITVNGKQGYMYAQYITLAGNTSSSGTTSTNKALGEKIAAKAQEYVGVPYVYGGTSPRGFDCSGLVYYTYNQFGYTLARGAGGQWERNGTAVSKANLQAGDLVFFWEDMSVPESELEIGHVGIYIGDGKFVHASSGKGEVTISVLDSYYYGEHYAGARRIV